MLNRRMKNALFSNEYFNLITIIIIIVINANEIDSQKPIDISTIEVSPLM